MSDSDKRPLLDIEVDAHLADAVMIDPEAMEEEFVRLPGDMAYWVEKASDARKEDLLAKRALDVCHAKLTMSVREEMIDEGAKRPTVGEVEARVIQDPEFEKLKLWAIEAEVERERTRQRVEVIRSKRDMLIALGNLIRSELMSLDPKVRSEREAQKIMGVDARIPRG